MALTFPSDTQRGIPAYFTKLGSLLLRYRYRTSVGDSNAANKVPLVIQGAPSQSANLVEVYDSSKNGLLAIDKSGNVCDANSLARVIMNPTAKTIVDGSATSLFDVACAASALVGGVIFYQVQVGDGTDFQSLTGMVTYSAVNKATAITLTITEVAANQAKAVSAGTLTLSWTFVGGTAKGTVKLQPTGSLTETTPYTVTYTVLPISGAVTIL